MSGIDPQQIELYAHADQLPAALWDDLCARDPEQAAQACGAELSGAVFSLPLLGRRYRVDATARSVTESDRPDHRVGYQAGLVLVTALARALPAPPSGVMVTPQELPGGSMFFTGPHAVPTAPLAEAFGPEPAALHAAAAPLGGEPAEGADAAVRLPALPMLPMWVLVWGGDEEFDASAVIGVDSRAHHHLALDGVWALCNLLSMRLTRGRHG